MNILLLSMPDSFEHMPTVAIRMPNGALVSLAGNVDPHHKVAVADLILRQDRIRETVTELVKEHQPDVVGMSIMTFQRRTRAVSPTLSRRSSPTQNSSPAATIPVSPTKTTRTCPSTLS